MKKMPLFLAVAMAALSLISCKKEQEQAPSAPQSSAASTLVKPELLTAGNWHQTGLTVSAAAEGANASATSDLFAHAKPAMLITTATYQPGGTYSLMRGARAGGELPSPITGQWHLNATADSLIVTQADVIQHLAITELTTTTLRLTHTEGVPGKLSTYTSVFSH